MAMVFILGKIQNPRAQGHIFCSISPGTSSVLAQYQSAAAAVVRVIHGFYNPQNQKYKQKRTTN
jgi:hypothetical protein